MAASDLITLIDAKITALLEDSGNVGDYHIGDKAVSSGQYLSYLTAAREKLVRMGTEEPYESIDKIAFAITEFGEDNSEYVGDALG